MQECLNIFLLHASEDKKRVRKLDQWLINEGFHPWLDERNLLPGQIWEAETTKAISSSDFVLICLSRVAVSKKGYIQKEIRHALKVAEEQPEGVPFIIPIMLEDCSIPASLQQYHCAKLFEQDGYQKLTRVFGLRAPETGLMLSRRNEVGFKEDLVVFSDPAVRLASLVRGVVDNLEKIRTEFADSGPDPMQIDRWINDILVQFDMPHNAAQEGLK